ncbi:unnamed protein product [Paramecium sonneborni]|uniref:Uncharacterized protein n=1 Tax=Paramecium sonneborni TaxID=65129 RepID=A0A8S1NWS4_9CILI|nr:unnamed protein product [Paramecium sonneborni]
MNLIEFMNDFVNNKSQIDMSIMKQYINFRNIQQINLEEFGLILTQMISFLSEEGDIQDLIYMSIYIAKNSPSHIVITQALNTLTVLLFNSNLVDLSKKLAKFNLKYFLNEQPQLFLITHLNLARIHYCQFNYNKCFRLVERALIKYEPYIFKEMKTNASKLQNNPSDIILLLNGYLFYGKCVQQLQKLSEMLDIDYDKFFHNGQKICRKFLNSNHYLFSYFTQQRSVTISRKSIMIKSKGKSIKVADAKKISASCNILMRQIKLQTSKNINEQQIKTQSESVKIEMGESATKSSERMIKQFRLHSPRQQQPPIDIQNIIQTKFDHFVQTFSSKKNEPKINALEKRISELQKENLKIQQQRLEREQEINELKLKIEELGNESNKFKQKLQEQQNIMHDRLSFGNMIPQQFEQPQQNLQFLPPPKQINRQSTTEIRCLIQTLNQGQIEDTIKVLKIPDINLSNSFNDEMEITIIDQLDQGREYTILLQNDITLIKKVIFDDNLQEISCTVHGNHLKIQFDNDKTETFDINALNNFFQVAELRAVLPYTCPLKCINSFNKFAQHLILPFVILEENQIKLSHLPSSILNEQNKLWIFEEECQIIVVTIEQFILRLIIIGSQQQGWIDLQFDQTSLDQFFDQYFYEEYEKESVQQMIRIINQTEQQFQSPSKKITHQVQSYVIKNKIRFIKFLESLKQNLENELANIFQIDDLVSFFNFLNGLQIQMPNNSQANVKMCCIKITEMATYQRIIIIADNNQEQCFEILLQNCYDTYAPRGTKVKAQGLDQFDYYDVNRIFGLYTSLLDYSDMQLLCYLLSQLFDLNTYAKELDLDDYDRYKENCIISNEVNSESCYRYFITSEYKVPVTISYLGINDRPIGVKLQVFDEINMIENGMFFSITAGIWDKQKKETIIGQQKKRKPPKYIQCNKMTTDYHLSFILQSVGWQVIFDNVSINQENLQACRILNDNKTTLVDRLENILNIIIKN